MGEFVRRHTDQEEDRTEVKILELIESTQDSKDKAFLLILLKINGSISNNTSIVTNVANKLDKHLTVFEEHAEEELKRLSHGAGIKKILTYVSGFIQTMLFGMILYFQGAIVEVKHAIVDQQAIIIKNTTIIQNHDKQLEQLIQKVNK